MMRRDLWVMLLAVVAVMLVASPLFAGSQPTKPPPRLSEPQARHRAAMTAKALGLEWDEAAQARLSGSAWVIGPRSSQIMVDGNTGWVIQVQRPYTSESSTAKPVSEDEAIAAAARLLRITGAPPDAKLGEAELVGRQWRVRCGRQTAQGVPYDGERTGVLVGSDGRIQFALLHWSSAPPPANTRVKVTKQHAVRTAKGFVKRNRLPGSYDQLIEAGLLVVQPNDHYSARRPRRATADATTPTRVAWAVSFPRPTSGSLTKQHSPSRFSRGTGWIRDIVWVDVADAKVLGGKAAGSGEPPGPIIKQIIAQRRMKIASVSGGVVAAFLVLGLAVWVRRRGRPAAQTS